MAQAKEAIAATVRDLRVTLSANAAFLRHLDEQEAEQIARKLDRFRLSLLSLAKKKI